MSRWYPETKQDKAKQYYDAAVELFKAARYLDSFHLFQRAYRLSVLGERGDSELNLHVCLLTIWVELCCTFLRGRVRVMETGKNKNNKSAEKGQK